MVYRQIPERREHTDRDRLWQTIVEFVGYVRNATSATGSLLADEGFDRIVALWPDHFLILAEDSWMTEHSMECRLSGEMPTCRYHRAAANMMDGVPPPEDWGRWLITGIDSEGCMSLERSTPQ